MDADEGVFKEGETLVFRIGGWIPSGRTSTNNFNLDTMITTDVLTDILLWLCDCELLEYVSEAFHSLQSSRFCDSSISPNTRAVVLRGGLGHHLGELSGFQAIRLLQVCFPDQRKLSRHY